MKTFIALITLFFLSGCASNIPPNIRQTPTPDLALSDVLAKTNNQKNPIVRWGGSILKITNHPKDTEIEILAMPLDSSGKPLKSDATLGRFLARVNGFLDPAIYTQNRMLTIYGPEDFLLTQKIGDKPYVYPMIQAQTIYLWPSASQDPFPYDCSEDYGAFGYFYNFGNYPYGGQYCMGHSW